MPPDALSLSRTELPEEIEKAIEELAFAYYSHGLGVGDGTLHQIEPRRSAEARSALTAAILSRLTNGAPASPSGSQASPEAPSDLRPSGVDPSRMQWQPIATAPRDGSEFLAACDRVADGFQQVVFWDDECIHPGWGTKDSDAVCPFGFFTHWRHLPTPPAQETEARRAETLGSACEGSVAEGHAPDLTEAGRLAIKDA